MGGIFSSSKEDCKTNHPELIESREDCSSKYPELIEHSESVDSGSDITNINLCVGDQVTGNTCNSGRPSSGWTSEACSQRYLPIEDTSNILAYQCIHSGAGNYCNSWNDDAGTATFCRVPPQ